MLTSIPPHVLHVYTNSNSLQRLMYSTLIQMGRNVMPVTLGVSLLKYAYETEDKQTYTKTLH